MIIKIVKPDWKNAPEWANWLAMDSDGSWYWYELKPVEVSHDWETPDLDSKMASAYEFEIDEWVDTLEERPNNDTKH